MNYSRCDEAHLRSWFNVFIRGVFFFIIVFASIDRVSKFHYCTFEKGKVRNKYFENSSGNRVNFVSVDIKSGRFHTGLTVGSVETRSTVTLIIVDMVHTCSIVLTGLTMTVVNI